MAQVGVDAERPPLHNRGRVLFGEDGSIDALIARDEAGWRFGAYVLGDRGELADLKARLPEGTILIGILRKDDRLLLLSPGQLPHVDEGDQLIAYLPPAGAEAAH